MVYILSILWYTYAHNLCNTAKLPLTKIRQLYFKLKNKVFANARFGVVYSTQELERILYDTFGDITMDQVQKPKSVISCYSVRLIGT